MIDTHIHLDELDDLDRELTEAREAGVRALVGMAVDPATCRQVVELAHGKPGVWAAVGHHPLNQAGPDLDLLRELVADPRVVAVGEVGLDHKDEHRGPLGAQEEWFHACCELAVERALPVCVHTRGSEQAVHQVLRSHPGITGVMHYWTLPWSWAERFLDLGLFISFSGVLTRASRSDLRQIAAMVPEDRLLLETDAPWGTPRGRSGKMRPAWMLDTAATLAEARGVSLERLAEIEVANVRALFPRLLP
ncbi:MAG: TatD family hydrolase [Candidatus Dormibacteraeota bacterium]|nr:TatD family hydrolase [Candidatus Dormibacteraeota bacterium]